MDNPAIQRNDSMVPHYQYLQKLQQINLIYQGGPSLTGEKLIHLQQGLFTMVENPFPWMMTGNYERSGNGSIKYIKYISTSKEVRVILKRLSMLILRKIMK